MKIVEPNIIYKPGCNCFEEKLTNNFPLPIYWNYVSRYKVRQRQFLWFKWKTYVHWNTKWTKCPICHKNSIIKKV